MTQETVLITGCSSGIGDATARAFLAEGWEVYATARDPGDIEALGDAGCHVDTLDVTDDADVERVVDRVVEEAGGVDCLVNNAGYGQFGPVEDVAVEKVRQQYEVNVIGVHRLIRAVLPHMREGDGGTIVNISSVAGRVAFPGGGSYCGSKHALEALTDALRNEVRDHGVDAVLIEPGPVDTQFTDRVAEEVEDDGVEESGAYDWFYDVLGDTSAIGGGGPGAVEPDVVADYVVNAASATRPRARYPVGSMARLTVLARFLPASVLDRVYAVARRVL